MAAFADSELLPCKEAQGVLDVNLDESREETAQTGCLFHLVLGEQGKAHPALQGLPWYPETGQGVGKLMRLVPREDAELLLEAVPGSRYQDAICYPALLSRPYGNGRVLQLACPMFWGEPSISSHWARLGEYHRKFLCQLAQWCRKN